MKKTLIISFLFLYSVGHTNDFEGLWLSTTRSKGGLGSHVNIYSESKAEVTFGALVNVNYRFEKSILSVFCPGEKVDTSSYHLVRDTLFLIGKSNGTQFKLQGYLESNNPRTGIDSIIGTWTFNYPGNVPSYYRFSRNGSGYLHVQMTRRKAYYKILDSNKIELVFEKDGSTTFLMDKEKNILVDNNGFHYERFDFQSK
jgi:hypothetical protein